MDIATFQCPGGQGPAQGHQNPRRDRSGREVLRLQAVRGYWRPSSPVRPAARGNWKRRSWLASTKSRRSPRA